MSENEHGERTERTDPIPDWGTQFDKYLIHASKKKYGIKIHVAGPVTGWTNNSDYHIVSGTPGTIDKNFIRVYDEQGRDVWVSRNAILAIEVFKV